MSWEIDFLKWIWENLHSVNIINDFFKYLTAAGDSWYPYVWQTLICIILMIFKKTRKTGFVLAFCLIFWSVLVNNMLIKNIVKRPRPFTQDNELLAYVETVFNAESGPLALPDSWSFMSGHTVNAFVLSTVIGFYHRKTRIPLLIYAILMSFSRLFFGVHYPSDVIAGALFAIVVVTGTCLLANRIEKRILHRRKQKANVDSA
ncbi:MAG: phosphatase PAP2 family protein [Bacilli bacterium]|jgi:undecaprenyl-diphosphatase